MSSRELLDRSLKRFDACVTSDRIAHAYLVVGSPSGLARDFVIEALGGLLKRDLGAKADPVTNSDVMWVEPEKKSRTIVVDQVRAVTRRLSETSLCGSWKACVFVGADRLNEPASNALLKTLEEPQGRTLVFLLTDRPQELLPTISSRCQRIILSGSAVALPDAAWNRKLEAIMASEDTSVIGGAVSAMALEGLLKEIREGVEKAVSEELPDDTPEDEVENKVESRYRGSRDTVLTLLELWTRDIFLAVCGLDDKAFHNGSMASQIRKRAAGLSCGEAMRMIEAVEDMKHQFEAHIDERSVLRFGFDKLSAGGVN